MRTYPTRDPLVPTPAAVIAEYVRVLEALARELSECRRETASLNELENPDFARQAAAAMALLPGAVSHLAEAWPGRQQIRARLAIGILAGIADVLMDALAGETDDVRADLDALLNGLSTLPPPR